VNETLDSSPFFAASKVPDKKGFFFFKKDFFKQSKKIPLHAETRKSINPPGAPTENF